MNIWDSQELLESAFQEKWARNRMGQSMFLEP